MGQGQKKLSWEAVSGQLIRQRCLHLRSLADGVHGGLGTRAPSGDREGFLPSEATALQAPRPRLTLLSMFQILEKELCFFSTHPGLRESLGLAQVSAGRGTKSILALRFGVE